ncbi:MAG: hypothetical protein ABMA14_00190 [Hyphomonadaceae bacterium]
MFRGFRRAIPPSVKRKMLTALHLVVGKPVVAAMRQRNLELEQVFDQRLARLEARLLASETSVEMVKSRRDSISADFRQDILARQDLLISILEQRIVRLERPAETLAANDSRDVPAVANDVASTYNKLFGSKIAQ